MADIRGSQRVRIFDSINETEVLVAVRDVAAGAADGGIQAMGVRDDGGGSLVSTDGDITPLSIDATGNLRVTVTGGGGAQVIVDDTPFTPAVDSVAMIGAFADETAPDSVDEGDAGAVRMTLDRQLRVRLESEYAEDTPHTTGDLGVFNMAVRNDAGTPLAGDGDYIPLTTNATGDLRVAIVSGTSAPSKADDSPFTIGVDLVSPAGFLADETAPDSVDEGDVGLARMTLDRKVLNVLVDATTDANRAAIDVNGNQQVLLYGSADATSVNAEDNPIYVQVVSTTVSGSEVHDYNTAAAVAKDAVSNHDYTVANATFLLKRVLVSASGAAKWEIQTGPVAGLATVGVLFTTAGHPTDRAVFDPPVEVPVAATGTVRVIRRNDDNQAMDLYSTIMGNDV